MDQIFDEPLPDLPRDDDEIWLFAVAFNEELRLEAFLDHHRAIGVKRFLIIDNNSTDGTRRILEGHDDVVRIGSAKSYRECRKAWKSAIAEKYFVDRWMLILDIDELFVYPGWPDRSVKALADDLDSEGSEGLFCSLVDMYSDLPFGEIQYMPGRSLIDACPYFDATGYRLQDRTSRLDEFPWPTRLLYGGARERLFPQRIRSARFGSWLRDAMCSLDRPDNDEVWRRMILSAGGKVIDKATPKKRDAMSKIPFFKSRSGLYGSPGNHVISLKINLSRHWGALLHFKYLQDFADKTKQAIARGQHTNGASHYKHYIRFCQKWNEQSPLYPGSRRFDGMDSLISAGLVR